MPQELSLELLAAIEEAAKAFQADTLARLVAQIRRRKLVNTKDLLDSLDAESRSDLSRVVHTMTFAFQEHGRYKDPGPCCIRPGPLPLQGESEDPRAADE